jgi:hypothetical protein
MYMYHKCLSTKDKCVLWYTENVFLTYTVSIWEYTHCVYKKKLNHHKYQKSISDL